MKVTIEASQEEFDQKRPELLKRLAGDKYEIISKAQPKKSKLLAHKQMVEHWDSRYAKMVKELKKDISDILSGVFK